MSSTDSSKKGSGSSGRRVDNMGPILMSPGGTFKVPPQNIFNPANAATATPPSRSPSKVSRSVDLEGGVAALECLLEIPDPNELVLRELFGGALSMQIPRSFEDVSIIREVPDHQEVYVDKESDISLIIELLAYDSLVTDDQAAQHYFNDLAQCNEAGSSGCIECAEVISEEGIVPLIDLWCPQPTQQQTQSNSNTNTNPHSNAHSHSHSQTQSNSGSNPQSQSQSHHDKSKLPYPTCGAIGRQTVTKFRKQADSVYEEVIVLLCVVRLIDVDTELLITLNVPLPSSESPILPPNDDTHTADCIPSAVSTDSMAVRAVGKGTVALLEGYTDMSELSVQPSVTDMFLNLKVPEPELETIKVETDLGAGTGTGTGTGAAVDTALTPLQLFPPLPVNSTDTIDQIKNTSSINGSSSSSSSGSNIVGSYSNSLIHGDNIHFLSHSNTNMSSFPTSNYTSSMRIGKSGRDEMSMSEKQKLQIEEFSQLHFQQSIKTQTLELIVPESDIGKDDSQKIFGVEDEKEGKVEEEVESEEDEVEKLLKLSPLQVMRSVLRTIAVHNWSLFA